MAGILPPVSGTAADPSVNEQPLRSSPQGQTAQPPGATSPEGVPKLDTQGQMPVNILKGTVVASAPKSLQIQVTGEESSTPISVRVGLKTKFIPFRRPAVGETVEVEYQDENGDKFGYVVKMVGVPPRATIPAVTPKPDVQSQMPVKQVTGEEPGTEATLDEQLLEAVRHGDVALAKTLLNSGADTIDLKKMREPGSCLLMEACRKGRIDIVKLLLDKGASANDGSALAAAAGGSYLPGHGGGHLDVVKLLVEEALM